MNVSEEIIKVAAYLSFDVYYSKKDNVIECELEIGNCSISLLQKHIKDFKKMVEKEIDKALKLNLFEMSPLSVDEKRMWLIDKKLNYSIMGLNRNPDYLVIRNNYKIK